MIIEVHPCLKIHFLKLSVQVGTVDTFLLIAKKMRTELERCKTTN